MSESIKVFAPATVANVGCGYDILGFALEKYGDTITLQERDDQQLVVTKISGAEGIPMDAASNVATIAIKAMMDQLGQSRGFNVEIEKNIAPGSGLGSSASSSAAAVFGANVAFDYPFSKEDLIPFAMEGEKAASTKAHADNVAPSLLGGFTVIRSYDPLDVFNIPFPEDLHVSIIFPNIEIKTADAKKILRSQIDMSLAVTQWGNVAGLIAGLTTGNLPLVGRSLEDVIVEPVRSILIPYFEDLKSMAMENGALGFSISGSGPSMFALSDNPTTAGEICKQAQEFYQEKGLECMVFESQINKKGAVLL